MWNGGHSLAGVNVGQVFVLRWNCSTHDGSGCAVVDVCSAICGLPVGL